VERARARGGVATCVVVGARGPRGGEEILLQFFAASRAPVLVSSPSEHSRVDRSSAPSRRVAIAAGASGRLGASGACDPRL
jgi:hypothetical protein